MADRDRSPSPIRDKKVAALRRKSSLGHSIRKSRSVYGIAFEDQVSALNKNSSIEERLLQITSMSLAAATRLLQQDYDSQDASEENPQADLSDHIRSKVGGRPLIDAELLTKLKESASKMAKCGDKHEPAKIIPPRLKCLNDIVKSKETESNEWKDLHHSRKNKFYAAKTEIKMVRNGQKVINNECRDDLPKSDDAWIRSLSDGQAEWAELKHQEKVLAIAKKELLLQINRKRRAVRESEALLQDAVNKICKFTETLHSHVEPLKSTSVANEVLSTDS